jgi:phosphate transport system substrate-binding protein
MTNRVGLARRGAGLIACGLIACNSVPAADVRIVGAGATFPNPIYQRWVGEYQKSHPEVKIDYQSIGSGGGIKGITEKTVHFAGSDAPMSKKEIAAAGGEANLVEIPSVAGAVVPAYNLPGIPEVKFSGEVLAQIYMGTISKWNDPKIAALNAGVPLPDAGITPVYRTDGSGTTFVWTSYLASQSEDFKSTVGMGKQVNFKTGQGGKGNEGVAAAVQQTPGSIGYLEVNYATQNRIPFGSVRNRDGHFVKASAQTVAAAGEGAVGELKGTLLAANIWDRPGADAYPISSFTYLIVYKDLANIPNADGARALADFLWWAAHEGQAFAREMDYAPLSPGVQHKVEEALRTITYKGAAVSSQAK